MAVRDIKPEPAEGPQEFDLAGDVTIRWGPLQINLSKPSSTGKGSPFQRRPLSDLLTEMTEFQEIIQNVKREDKRHLREKRDRLLEELKKTNDELGLDE